MWKNLIDRVSILEEGIIREPNKSHLPFPMQLGISILKMSHAWLKVLGINEVCIGVNLWYQQTIKIPDRREYQYEFIANPVS